MNFRAPAIVVEGLHKAFGRTIALQGVDLVVEPGTVQALLGPLAPGRARWCKSLGRVEAAARAAEVLERLSLTTAADRRVFTYSGGMRRRLDVGASLVGRPIVLIMDEPTTELDPDARESISSVLQASGANP